MKLQQLQLCEGLIKVPQKLSSVAMQYLHNMIVSQALNDIDDKFGAGSEVNQFRMWARRTYPGVRIISTNIAQDEEIFTLPSITKADFDARYQEMISDNVKSPRLLISNRSDISGEFDNDANVINVSISRITSWDWKVYGMAVQYGGVKGQSAINEILARVKDTITSIDGTLMHELMHFIQFRLLVTKHLDQIGGNRDDPVGDDNYFMDKTEFDPQIESAVANTIAWFSRMQRNVGNTDIKIIASYVTSSITKNSAVASLGTDKMLPPQIEFFSTLKRRQPVQWKKAVAKYYQTLMSRLQG